jgi:AbrB family looped-hinge helix DNA binding protein
MNTMNNKRLRTVAVNDRGQIVIPEEVRKDLGIDKNSTLVLIELEREIVLRKESDVLEGMEEEDRFWKALANESLKNFWSKEDEVWDKLYADDTK